MCLQCSTSCFIHFLHLIAIHCNLGQHFFSFFFRQISVKRGRKLQTHMKCAQTDIFFNSDRSTPPPLLLLVCYLPWAQAAEAVIIHMLLTLARMLRTMQFVYGAIIMMPTAAVQSPSLSAAAKNKREGDTVLVYKQDPVSHKQNLWHGWKWCNPSRMYCNWSNPDCMPSLSL